MSSWWVRRFFSSHQQSQNEISSDNTCYQQLRMP
jgi:hypothetical protein